MLLQSKQIFFCKNIEQLKDSFLVAIEQLKAEVLQIQTVNFKKYADHRQSTDEE